MRVYAVTDYTMSICAHKSHSREAVMRLAGAGWTAIDKSQPPLSAGQATPNQCEWNPEHQHWFLVREELLDAACRTNRED